MQNTPSNARLTDETAVRSRGQPYVPLIGSLNLFRTNRKPRLNSLQPLLLLTKFHMLSKISHISSVIQNGSLVLSKIKLNTALRSSFIIPKYTLPFGTGGHIPKPGFSSRVFAYSTLHYNLEQGGSFQGRDFHPRCLLLALKLS